MSETGKVYLTTEELAKRWNISANTLRSWRFKGEGPPYFKPGGEKGKTLYRIEDVEAFEAKNTVGGTAATGGA